MLSPSDRLALRTVKRRQSGDEVAPRARRGAFHRRRQLLQVGRVDVARELAQRRLASGRPQRSDGEAEEPLPEAQVVIVAPPLGRECLVNDLGVASAAEGAVPGGVVRAPRLETPSGRTGESLEVALELRIALAVDRDQPHVDTRLREDAADRHCLADAGRSHDDGVPCRHGDAAAPLPRDADE